MRCRCSYFNNKKPGELCPSMKDSGYGMGVKNISDLVLKEIYAFAKKNAQKRKLTNTKWEKD